MAQRSGGSPYAARCAATKAAQPGTDSGSVKKAANSQPAAAGPAAVRKAGSIASPIPRRGPSNPASARARASRAARSGEVPANTTAPARARVRSRTAPAKSEPPAGIRCTLVVPCDGGLCWRARVSFQAGSPSALSSTTAVRLTGSTRER